MRLVLRYAEKTKAGSWQYRRRVPKDLSATILKREFKKKLGDIEREALAAYPAFHALVEREIAEARRKLELNSAADRGELSDRQAFQIAHTKAVEMGMNSTDWDGRDHLAYSIIHKYPREEETGHPVIPNKVDAYTVAILQGGEKAKPPHVTLGDAMEFYLSERDQTEAPEFRDRFKQQVERVVGHVVEPAQLEPLFTLWEEK